MKPKKRKITKSPVKNICGFPSQKGGPAPLLITESILECDCCYHFEFDPFVFSIEAQPVGWFLDEDGYEQYTPDFKVKFLDGSTKYFEVKYLEETLETDFQARWKVVSQSAINQTMSAGSLGRG